MILFMALAFASPVRAEPSRESQGVESSSSVEMRDAGADGDTGLLSEGHETQAPPEDPSPPIADVRFELADLRVPPPGRDPDLQIDVSANSEFILGAEFDDTEMSSSQSHFVFEVGGPVSRAVSIGARVRLGVRDFGFDGDGQFIDSGRNSGDPFDELFEYSLTLGTRIRLIDGLDLELSGRGISRIERGAEFVGGLEGGGSVSFLGRYHDWLVLRLGVGLQSNFDRSSVNVSPTFRLRLRVHERLWAETGGRSGRLEYSLTDRVRIDLFGGIEGGRYRLENRRDGPVGVGDGSIRLTQTDVGVATRIMATKRLRIQLEAGVVLVQTIEIKDEDGDFVDERENRDPAFRGRVSLKWRF